MVKDGERWEDGRWKSAYQIWLDQGNNGNELDSVVTANLDTSGVLVSNPKGKISVSGIATRELNYLDNAKFSKSNSGSKNLILT